MSVFICISFFHVAVAESESTEQKSISLGNGHVINFLYGVSFSSFLEILDSSINKVIYFLYFY